ncbi:thiamine-monophosphate kinase [bacterium]|nr:thiamine-monophosphate kinase [bacterium]
MNKENQFLDIISKTISDNSYLGDDCAYLRDFGLVSSQDNLVEGVHFDFSLMNYCEVGAKAVLVNLSDIFASGSKPLYILIGISGKLNEEFISEFYRGVSDVCAQFGVKIIGGDLTSGDKITISIAALGVPYGLVSSLNSASAGDVICLRGVCGASSLGFKDLIAKVDSPFISYHKRPELFPKTSEIVSRCAKGDYVMTDLSDGLYTSLSRISRASGVLVDVCYNEIPKLKDDFNSVIFGGEDYSLLCVLDREHFEQANNLGAGLVAIGEVLEGTGVMVDGKNLDKDLSYEHF